MKKAILMMLLVAMVAACEKPAIDIAGTKNVTFAVSGDFKNPHFTRSMMADGKEMTDLLVYDYMGDALVQELHQTVDDENFGMPNLSLAYGDHQLYFVASRGQGLSVSNTVVSWTKPSDTFWASVAVSVSNNSPAEQAVTLNRVATCLRLIVTDKVPAGVAMLTVKPTQWWRSIDYTSGLALQASNEEIEITVPSSYIGTEGQLIAKTYCISDEDEWMTDVVLSAKDADGNTIGSVTITQAPFMRNRVTEYSGRLFSSSSGMTVSLNDTWLQSYTDEW